MYKGYNVIYNPEWSASNRNYVEIGESISKHFQNEIKKSLHEFIHKSTIDGSKMQEEWFPQSVKADIFISHSHKDLDNAMALAGMLKNKFNIDCFIDSCVWGNSNELLKEIDDAYNVTKVNPKVYSYEATTFSASHVHMMLSNALAMMIDNTEGFFFLNTPNSITGGFNSLEQTQSPWIYNEIIISKLVRKKKPSWLMESLLRKSESFSNFEGDIKHELKINYNLDLSHLIKVNFDNGIWVNGNFNTKSRALSTLFEL